MSNDHIPNDAQSSHEQWRPCKPGALGRVVAGVHARRRRRLMGQVAAGALVFLLAISAAWRIGAWSADGDHVIAGIACTEVQSNLPQYAANQLDAELAERIAAHLQACPECSRRYDQMNKSSAHVQRADIAAWRRSSRSAEMEMNASETYAAGFDIQRSRRDHATIEAPSWGMLVASDPR